jgi:hypothetical protein
MSAENDKKIIVDPYRINIVFDTYGDFSNALVWPAAILNHLERLGMTGAVTVSLDSGSSKDDKPSMSLFGNRDLVNTVVDGLDKEGIGFRIDVTEDPEPNIVKRKWDRSLGE